MDYFISDLHLGHGNIITLERTQFKTIDDHDQYIIDAINSQLSDNDNLYILGDIWTPSFLDKIKGNKYLVLGNHDKLGLKHYQAVAKKVYKTPVYYDRRTLLSHHPHPVPDGVVNIHGHLHGGYLDSNQHINVSINDRDYKLLSHKDVRRQWEKIGLAGSSNLSKWYADIHKGKKYKR